MYIINLNSISWLHRNKQALVKCLKRVVWEFHWSSEPLISVSRSAVVLLPWKTEPFSPRCAHSFSGQGEDGTNFFTHECLFERRETSVLQYFPLGQKLGAGEGGYFGVILLFVCLFVFLIFIYLGDQRGCFCF